MGEFIGSRISLVSKRDIRYVGTLHEINSENSTVALEQVVSFGTEGRRPGEEVPASDNVYEYIVFRGSDVKDLRIEEPAPPKENKPPQIPDDPAILGSQRRPESSTTSQGPAAPPTQKQTNTQQTTPSQQAQHPMQGPQQPKQQPPQSFPHQPPYGYPYGPPPNQRFGPYGFPQGPGFPGIPYGAPPPWGYPPPGQGFPHQSPRQFIPHQMPIGSGGQQQGPQAPPQQPPSAVSQQLPDQAPAAPSQKQSPKKPTATVKLPSTATSPAPTPLTQSGPPPPTNTKPNVAAALATPATNVAQAAPSPRPISAAKNGRIVPAVPRVSPAVKPAVPVNGTTQTAVNGTAPATQAAVQAASARPVPVPTKSVEDANRDAVAAVQAAMAKLPPAPGQKKATDGDKAVDNLTNKINEMRTNDNIRTSKQPGTGGYAAGHRGGRGGHRGGRSQNEHPNKKIEVPKADYDFTTANAKFNKQDLVKEAIATGSPLEDGEITNDVADDGAANGISRQNSETVAIPPAPSYNKASSFFDNISSEAKEREEGTGSKRLGGREFRSEEQRKNLETFGQGSVDNGYRGGYRGRGRGRGYGGRARSGYAGRGGYGPRGGSARGGRGVVSAET